MKPRKKPVASKSIAKERIDILFKEAEKDLSNAKNFVKRAREIGMKYRVRMPIEYKKKYCKACNAFLKPGVNCRVRLIQKQQSRLIYTCDECGHVMRVPYKPKKRVRTKEFKAKRKTNKITS